MKNDERLRLLSTRSLAVAGGVAYFYALVSMIIKLVWYKSIQSVYTELGLLIIMFVVMLMHRLYNRNYDLPTTWTGKVLPTGKSTKDFKKRLLYYLIDATKFTIVFTLIRYLWRGSEGFLIKIQNLQLAFIVQFIITLIFTTLINALWFEFNVKRYNDYCDSLDSN